MTSVAKPAAGALLAPAILWLSGCAGFQQANVTGYDHITVYYATTRQYDPAAPINHAFTSLPTKREFVNFGEAQVSVPLPHSEGVQKAIRVEKLEPPKAEGEGDFYRRTHAETVDPERPLVVFVHGFNNDFETAAERAALFAKDLQPNVSNKAAIFSWPSRGSLFGYFADEDRVLVNQDRARKVLEDLRVHVSPSQVVLIGHSMGCRVLTFALRDLELIDSKGKPPKLGHPEYAQLIFIEPDVDKEYFRINIGRLRAICEHVTVYASSHDNALRFSSFLHTDPREGEVGSQGLLKKIDVIDASAAKTDLIGHSYDGPQLFEDMKALLRGETVEQRVGHTLVKRPSGVFALTR